MRKIDWYILKKFLFTFFFCLLLFTVVAVAVDSSEHTDDFVKSGLSASEIITKYYFGFVPYIIGLLFPLFAFIAVIFFTSRMALRAEIIAILASGTSFNRMLRPYLIGGIFLSLLLWWASRDLIPKGNEIRADFNVKYVDKFDPNKYTAYGNAFYRRSDTNTYIGIRYYDSTQKSAGGFFLHRIKDDKVIYNLRAQSMKWDTSTNNWLLTNAVERKIERQHEVVTNYGTYHINVNIKPSDLRNDQYTKDKLTTEELREFIKMERLRGSEGLNTYEVELYRRTATAVSILLLTFIGVVLASRKTRGGSGLHLALGIIIAALFIISDRFSTTFSVKANFSPLLAAWLPNIVFSGVAYYLYRKAPK
jgi:lipopolysaccharide export system permease protein